MEIYRNVANALDATNTAYIQSVYLEFLCEGNVHYKGCLNICLLMNPTREVGKVGMLLYNLIK